MEEEALYQGAPRWFISVCACLLSLGSRNRVLSVWRLVLNASSLSERSRSARLCRGGWAGKMPEYGMPIAICLHSPRPIGGRERGNRRFLSWSATSEILLFRCFDLIIWLLFLFGTIISPVIISRSLSFFFPFRRIYLRYISAVGSPPGDTYTLHFPNVPHIRTRRVDLTRTSRFR